MKKTLLLLTVALFASVSAHAQLGITGGLTSSSTQVKDMEDVKSVNQYHAGLVYKFDLGVGFAIQPGILYQVKGVNLGAIGSDTKSEDFELKTGFIEVPVQLQWGPDLLAFRPYLFAEPFIGYAVTSSDNSNATASEVLTSWAENAKNKMEFGFGLGAGLEIANHVQLSAQYFNNLGKVFHGAAEAAAETDAAAAEAVLAEKVKNFQGIKVSLTLLF